MKEPNYTCPIIDRAQADTEGLEEDVLSTIQQWVKYHNDELEKVRTANSELRDWGQHWESTARDLEKDLDRANDRIQELEQNIEELEQQIVELQKQLTEVTES